MAGLLVTVLGLGLVPTRGCEHREEQARNALASVGGRPSLSGDLVLVTIGERAERALGGAVPRKAHARVLEALAQAGAQVIAYDVPLFQEGRDGPEGTQALAQAAKSSGRAVFPVLCDLTPQMDPSALRGRLLPTALDAGRTPAFNCPGALPPVGPLAESAQLGHLHGGQEVPLFIDVLGLRIPSLGLATYARARELPLSAVKQEPGSVQVGRLTIPVDARGQLPVRERTLSPGAMLSFEELLAGIEDTDPPELPRYLADRVRGRVLLVAQLGEGSSAGAVRDRVVRSASHLSDLLEERVPRSLSLLARLAVVLVGGLLGTALGTWLTGRKAWLAAGGWLLFVLVFTWVLSRFGIFTGPLTVAFTGLLAWVASASVMHATVAQERQALETAFAPYVSPDTLSRILRNPEGVSLSGTERTVTVLYCDLGAVSQLVGEQPAGAVLDHVRRAILELSEQVTRRGGRIERVLGDGILAVFGDPLPDEQHAVRAVEAGLAMLDAGWRRATESGRSRSRISVRVGVASGQVVSGALGGVRGAFVYGVVGTPVHQALRLQGRAPAGALLISQSTKEACGSGFDLLEVPAPLMRGSNQEGPAHLVVGQRLESDPERQAARLSVDAQVRVQGKGVVGSGRVLDVSAGGMRLRADVHLSLGDKLDVEFASLGTGSSRPVRVTGEVRHAEDAGGGATTVGMSVDRAETPGAAAHVFAALFLGATRLDSELGVHTRSGDVFDAEGDTLVRRGPNG